MDFAAVAATAAATQMNDHGRYGAGISSGSSPVNGDGLFGGQQPQKPYDVVDNAKDAHTPHFVCHEEEEAVTEILMACQNATGSASNGAYYIERDEFGHVISLMDVGKTAASAASTSAQQHNGENDIVWTSEWDMPPTIGRLVFLQKLTVYRCRSIPAEIKFCTQLKELSLKFCHGLQALPTHSFAFLSNLTDLRIHGRTSPNLRIVPSIKTLPSLKYLYYRASCPHGGSSSAPTVATKTTTNGVDGQGYSQTNQFDFHVEDLLDESIAFRDTLELLEIEGASLTERHVSALFETVLPRYPNLQRVVLPNNHIRSLGPLVHATKRTIVSIGNGTQLPPTVRLRALNLLGNPVLQFATYGQVEDKNNGDTRPEPQPVPTQEQREDLSRQQTYLLELLTLHEEMSNLGFGFTESALCTADILMMLDLNDAGRVLLTPKDHDDDNNNNNIGGGKKIVPPSRFQPIALSVWPTVLERADSQKGYHPSLNAMYHLLRYGPIVRGQKEEITRHRNTKHKKRAATTSTGGGKHSKNYLRYHKRAKASGTVNH
mmetsp:Transcript_4919/g.12489  ORF Transcript_4919/g.12489 Transcript_4919/m.12489 type:complete len:545 (-) Transcript_4919:297-1931(-)